jgi:uncharacterized membrane protein
LHFKYQSSFGKPRNSELIVSTDKFPNNLLASSFVSDEILFSANGRKLLAAHRAFVGAVNVRLRARFGKSRPANISEFCDCRFSRRRRGTGVLFFPEISRLARARQTRNTSLLAVMIPVFTFLISAFIGIEKLTRRKILGIIIAGFGVVYLIDPTKASFSSATTQGDILIILNSLSYAIYVAISKNLISKYGALKSIAWLFLFGSIINVPVGFYSMQSVEISNVSTNAWLALGAIIIFPTILAYYWNAWALARVEPSVVAIYVYLQPLIGFFSAVVFLGETFSFRSILAMILIFIGVYLVIRRRK